MARDGAVLAEGVHRESRSHTASLPLLVERVLGDAGLALEDVEGIAVSIGPGSFTGLRIGLALAKGLAFAGGLPLVGVPTLEALAWVVDAAPGTSVCAALDARKREVYGAVLGAHARLLPFATHHPRGGVIARLGAARLAAGEAANVGTLEPVYVRPPDAALPRSRSRSDRRDPARARARSA